MANPTIVGISNKLNNIRGVIANKNIKKGTLIETCNMIVIDKIYEQYIDKTPLTNYYFEWGKSKICFLLGNGSLYNHSYEANVRLKEDKKNNQMILIAYKDISKGEELTINYNGYPNSKLKLDDNYLSFDNFVKEK